MIFLTFRYSRCLPDQSCFLIGRNSKMSKITCLMELLHSWNVRYLDLQNICVFLLVKIPRWPPPQDKFNTWPYGKHISKSLLSETTEQFDRIFGWNVPLMVISKYLFYGDKKFMMAATTIQSFCTIGKCEKFFLCQKLEIWLNTNCTWTKFQIMFELYNQMAVTAGNS